MRLCRCLRESARREHSALRFPGVPPPLPNHGDRVVHGEVRTGGTYSIRDIIGVVRRKTCIAEFGADSKMTIDLHGSRRDVIALDAWRLASTAQFNDSDTNTARSQIDSQSQTHGTRADD
jgi:hypothetical protein